MRSVFLIEFIHKQSRVKPDAAICIAFTTLFAFGVVMMSGLESRGAFHIDAECVLYGEIAFVPLEPAVVFLGCELGPLPVVRMALVLLVLVLLVVIFYKELLITSFDPGLARSLGMRVSLWHYGLMAALAVVIVAVFESVGAILAVAMLFRGGGHRGGGRGTFRISLDCPGCCGAGPAVAGAFWASGEGGVCIRRVRLRCPTIWRAGNGVVVRSGFA